MHEIPSVDIAIKVNKILGRNKALLKEYQDKNGKINFNLLIGLVLGGICSFADKPAINQILRIFFPIFKEYQLNDYANLMMGLNNYLVYTLDANLNDIYVLENNKWISVTEANSDSIYTLWYGFFGIMKVEFEHSQDKINKLKSNQITIDALRCYSTMHKIMTATTLDDSALNIMQHEFPLYAYNFNELRKLMYTDKIQPEATVH